MWRSDVDEVYINSIVHGVGGVSVAVESNDSGVREDADVRKLSVDGGPDSRALTTMQRFCTNMVARIRENVVLAVP